MGTDRLLLINAMGGVGKTTLANALIHAYKDQFSHIIWLDAKVGVKEAFVNNLSLLDNLGLTADVAAVYKNTADSVDKAYQLIVSRLKQVPRYGLLILDDADEKLEAIAPAFSLKDNWKLLVTSRSKLEGFEIYPLGFLSTHAAINLFFHYAKIERNTVHEAISKLIVTSVWNHTLTIELLAKTISENDAFSIYSLKEKLEQGGIRAVPEHEIKSLYAQEKNGSEEITTSTKSCLKMAFDVYQFAGQEWPVKALTYMSVLPPVPIHFPVLIKLFGVQDEQSEVDFSNTLRKLVRQSWLIKSEAGYHMHPVIQEVIRDVMHVAPENTLQLLNTLTESSRAFKNFTATDLFLYSTYIRNVLAIFKEKKDPAVADLAYNYAVLLRNIGRPAEALKYHQIAKDYREEKQPGSAGLAEVLCGIAAIKINLGELEEAESLLRQTLAIQEDQLPPNDHNIAISHHNLAVIYKKWADKDQTYLAKAARENQATIDILQDNPEHQEELSTALIFKAQLAKRNKDYDIARQQLTEAKKIRSNLYGEQHYMTVRVDEELSLISKLEEKWDEGYWLMRTAMPIIEDYFEKESLNLGTPYHNYAFFLFKQGYRDQAITLQKKAIDIFSYHLPQDSIYIKKAKQQLEHFEKGDPSSGEGQAY